MTVNARNYMCRIPEVVVRRMYYSKRAPVITVASGRVPFVRSSIRFRRLRHSLVLLLVVLSVAAVLWTVMFSSWNVCRPDYDDDVDAQMAASSSSSRRSAKTCLSPLTHAGQRVNVRLDSYDDLEWLVSCTPL